VLALFATVLFAYLFVDLPLVIRARGLSHWVSMVVVLYVFVALIGIEFYVMHRMFLPKRRRERWVNLALLLPAPTMAIRAGDKIARHLLAGTHPFAAACTLGIRRRQEAAGIILRDLKHPRLPLPAHTDATAHAIESAFRARVLALCESYAPQHSVDVNTAYAAPKMPTSCVAYCPRCRTPYRVGARACGDCGGVPLVPVVPAAVPVTTSAP
jgi:hypothetical protein